MTRVQFNHHHHHPD
ncbi:MULTISPECIES: his operon leader peptide [Erwiniaceae]|nr:his operon leader peptide [Erwinia sp. S38]MBK0002150.1 his operon leader peptide [Erwinia sp. S38]